MNPAPRSTRDNRAAENLAAAQFRRETASDQETVSATEPTTITFKQVLLCRNVRIGHSVGVNTWV